MKSNQNHLACSVALLVALGLSACSDDNGDDNTSMDSDSTLIIGTGSGRPAADVSTDDLLRVAVSNSSKKKGTGK